MTASKLIGSYAHQGNRRTSKWADSGTDVPARTAHLKRRKKDSAFEASMQQVVTASLLLALLIGILPLITGIFFSDSILRLLGTPDTILSTASRYFLIYCIGMPFLLLYDFGSALLRAGGDSRRPLFIMILSGCINLLLNLILVIVFHAGVAGVASATAVSNLVCAVLVLLCLWHENLLSRKALSHRFPPIRSILTIGIPAAIQGAVFCFANLFVQSAVNSFGTSVVAGSAIAVNFEYLTYYAITAFGQAATTYSGQNFAAGNTKRCLQTAIWSIVFSFATCGCMTVPLILLRRSAAALFSENAEVITAAGTRMGLILLWEPICACYESLAGTLRGTGRSAVPACITILGTCLVRILWITLLFPKMHTQHFLYIVFPVSWVFTSVCMVLYMRYSFSRAIKKAESD